MKHVGRASQNQNQNQKHGNKYGGLYAYKVHKHHNHDPKFAFKLHQKLKVDKPSKQVKRHGVVVKTSSRHHKPTFDIEVNNVRQCSGLRKKHCNRSKRDLCHKKSICNRKMKPSKQEETRFSRMTESEFSTLIKNHLKFLLKNEKKNRRKQRPSNTEKKKKKRSPQNPRISKVKNVQPVHQSKMKFEISNDLKNLHRNLKAQINCNK